MLRSSYPQGPERKPVKPGYWTGVNRHGRGMIAAVAAIVGVATSVAAFLVIASQDDLIAELDFRSRAATELRTIEQELADTTDVLLTIQAFFESAEHTVSQAEYGSFSMRLRERAAGLRRSPNQPIVVAGSLYLVGAVRAMLAGEEAA